MIIELTHLAKFFFAPTTKQKKCKRYGHRAKNFDKYEYGANSNKIKAMLANFTTNLHLSQKELKES